MYIYNLQPTHDRHHGHYDGVRTEYLRNEYL